MIDGKTLTVGWREAFAKVDQLLTLDEGARAREMAGLAATREDLYSQVLTLMRAALHSPNGEPAKGVANDGDKAASRSKFGPGVLWGPYRCERPLGAGGMGEVWLAKRVDGFYEGQVAIKCLHAHLGAPGLRDRFAREGHILGKLTHPHIARLLDAGVTGDGLPVLVLEYIEGERIDRWCDVRMLDLVSRLRLFLSVCDAVAHAHAHLIVHRDLKPSNILVTPAGTVKLLDFGIAKLLQDEGDAATAEETELTRLGGRVLTPEYAAPEQVLGNAITTVTDVYSLGVLLYQLVSGQKPYGKAPLTPLQLERSILEIEPPPPSQSVRMGKLDPTAPDHHAHRQASTPKKLAAALQGDLDNIVCKALKKNPADRYPSVLALADDLRRYLDHEPVAARGDPFGYRAIKFVRRHRTGVAATAVVSLALIAGILGTLWQAHRAEQQALLAQARAEDLKQVVAFQGSMLTRVDLQKLGIGWIDRMRSNIADAIAKDHPVPDDKAAQMLGDFDLARRWSQPSEVARQSLGAAILDPAQQEVEKSFKAQPRVRAALHSSVAEAYAKLGLNDAALTELQRAMAAVPAGPDAAESPEMLHARLLESAVLRNQGKTAEATAEAREVFDIRKRILGPNDRDTLEAGRVLTRALTAADDNKDVLLQAEPLLAAEEKVLGEEDAGTLDTETMIACAYENLGDLHQSIELLQAILVVKRRVLGAEDPSTLFTIKLIAGAMAEAGDAAKAQTLDEELLETSRRVYGEGHPQTLGALTNLATVVDSRGDMKRAFQLYAQAHLLGQRFLEDRTPLSQVINSNYAGMLEEQGRWSEANAIYQNIADVRSRTLGPEKPATLRTLSHVAHTLEGMNRDADARAMYAQVLAAQRRVLGPEHRDTLETWRDSATQLDAEGDSAAALAALDEMKPAFLRTDGPAALETLSTQIQRGLVLCHLRRYSEAETDIAAAIEQLKKSAGAQHPKTLEALLALAEVRAGQKRLDDATALAQQALDVQRARLGTDSLCLIPTLKTLAAYESARGNGANARALKNEAQRIDALRATSA